MEVILKELEKLRGSTPGGITGGGKKHKKHKNPKRSKHHKIAKETHEKAKQFNQKAKQNLHNKVKELHKKAVQTVTDGVKKEAHIKAAAAHKEAEAAHKQLENARNTKGTSQDKINDLETEANKKTEEANELSKKLENNEINDNVTEIEKHQGAEKAHKDAETAHEQAEAAHKQAEAAQENLENAKKEGKSEEEIKKLQSKVDEATSAANDVTAAANDATSNTTNSLNDEQQKEITDLSNVSNNFEQHSYDYYLHEFINDQMNIGQALPLPSQENLSSKNFKLEDENDKYFCFTNMLNNLFQKNAFEYIDVSNTSNMMDKYYVIPPAGNKFTSQPINVQKIYNTLYLTKAININHNSFIENCENNLTDLSDNNKPFSKYFHFLLGLYGFKYELYNNNPNGDSVIKKIFGISGDAIFPKNIVNSITPGLILKVDNNGNTENPDYIALTNENFNGEFRIIPDKNINSLKITNKNINLNKNTKPEIFDFSGVSFSNLENFIKKYLKDNYKSLTDKNTFLYDNLTITDILLIYNPNYESLKSERNIINYYNEDNRNEIFHTLSFESIKDNHDRFEKHFVEDKEEEESKSEVQELEEKTTSAIQDMIENFKKQQEQEKSTIEDMTKKLNEQENSIKEIIQKALNEYENKTNISISEKIRKMLPFSNNEHADAKTAEHVAAEKALAKAEKEATAAEKALAKAKTEKEKAQSAADKAEKQANKAQKPDDIAKAKAAANKKRMALEQREAEEKALRVKKATAEKAVAEKKAAEKKAAEEAAQKALREKEEAAEKAVAEKKAAEKALAEKKAAENALKENALKEKEAKEAAATKIQVVARARARQNNANGSENQQDTGILKTNSKSRLRQGINNARKAAKALFEQLTTSKGGKKQTIKKRKYSKIKNNFSHKKVKKYNKKTYKHKRKVKSNKRGGKKNMRINRPQLTITDALTTLLENKNKHMDGDKYILKIPKIQQILQENNKKKIIKKHNSK